jgi:hypothetical protein
VAEKRRQIQRPFAGRRTQSVYRGLVAILPTPSPPRSQNLHSVSPGLSEIPQNQRRFDSPWQGTVFARDDAMIRSRKQMTISELKRAMDRRFDRLERSKVGKAEFRKLQRAMDRRFDRLERTKADKVELHTLQRAMERRFDAMEQRFDGLERTMVDKNELASSAAETRRHFDVVAESIRADVQLFADPIRGHTDQLN